MLFSRWKFYPLVVLYLSFSYAHSLTAVATRPDVGLWWGVSGFSDGLSLRGGVGRPFSRVFDTPVDALFSNGSRGVHDGPGCVGGRFRVD